jgi:hypothetical protein
MSDESKDEIASIILLSSKFSKESKPIIGIKRQYNDMNYDPIEHAIVNNGMRYLHINSEEVEVAMFNRLLIKKSDGITSIDIESNHPKIDDFNKHMKKCNHPECVFNMIPSVLNDKNKTSDIMNHIIRCTNPHCSDKGCIYFKRVLKFNFIKTALNSYHSYKKSKIV